MNDYYLKLSVFFVTSTSFVLGAIFATILLKRKKVKNDKIEDEDIYSKIADKTKEGQILIDKPLPVYVKSNSEPSEEFKYSDPIQPVLLISPNGDNLNRLKIADRRNRVMRIVWQDTEGAFRSKTLKQVDKTPLTAQHMLSELTAEKARERRLNKLAKSMTGSLTGRNPQDKQSNDCDRH